MGQGRLIFVEGVDGCGKTTLINNIKEKFGNDIYYFREPGSTPAGDKIREILLDDTIKTNELTDMMLYTASRCELYKNYLEELLEKNKIIILDRSVISTLVYQPMKYLFNNELEKVKKLQDKIIEMNDFINYKKVTIYYIKEDPNIIHERLLNRPDQLNKRDNIDTTIIHIMQNMYEYVLNHYFEHQYFNSKDISLEDVIRLYL